MTSSVVVMVVVVDADVTLEQVFPAIDAVSVNVLVCAGELQYASGLKCSLFGIVLSVVVISVLVALLKVWGPSLPTRINIEVGAMDFVTFV
ncbi:hypothetical protein GDO81_006083 [Engystomops pustulosus]|uniref:Transmembrane protein n=1 Tax=Engystomops pustulosus TaxID=76066 RepID=A0AAV7CUI8_ENGPU|nr:hypothetical protein GDO81_006083 [Engystomops pustulosus]